MTTRRTILIAGGAVAAAGTLAACGSSSGAPSTSTPTKAGGALGPSADVPVGGGKVYDAAQVVVTQPTAGTFHCFSAVCPHAGCLVAGVENEVIVCPCHGSTFNVDTGAVIKGPAVRGLAELKVSDANGTLTLD